MTLEQIFRYGLIAAVTVLAVGVGGSYWYASSQPIGDECPRIAALPEGTEFQDRSRTEQRLNYDFDLRGTKGGADLSCLSVLGQAKCSVDGPAMMAGQVGYRGTPEIYDIPAGRTAVVRLSASRLLCVMLPL